MKILLAVCMLLALGTATATAEILNPPGGSSKGLLNGKVSTLFPSDFGPGASGWEFGRFEESAAIAGAYNGSRATRFWGGSSVPVWRGGSVSGALGSGALTGALVKGPGGVPVVRFGAVRGTSGLVLR